MTDEVRFFDPGDPEAARMAAMYEESMVPALFRPWADLLVARAGITRRDEVLDVACGTGAVERAVGDAKVVGVDLNPGMLAVAQSLGLTNAEFREGNAMSLPVDDASFDAALCQQGLQFVPDKVAALREMHRALRPGGRAVIACWRGLDENPMFAAVVDGAADLGWSAPGLDLPFSFGDETALRQAMTEAGFAEVTVERIERPARWPVEPWLRAYAEFPPLSTPSQRASSEEREAFFANVLDRLRPYEHDGVHEVPWTSSVAIGRKPG